MGRFNVCCGPEIATSVVACYRMGANTIVPVEVVRFDDPTRAPRLYHLGTKERIVPFDPDRLMVCSGEDMNLVTSLTLGDDFTLSLEQSGSDQPVTVDLSALASDFYADGVSFDEETRILTITRTGDLPPLTVEIPSDAQFPDTGTPYFLLQRGAAGGVLTEGRLFLGTMSSTPLPDDAIIMPGVPDGSPDTSAFRRAVATTAPTARTVAKRTADGTLKAADAVEPDDLVTLGQLPPPFELPAGTEWQVLQRDGDGEPMFGVLSPDNFWPDIVQGMVDAGQANRRYTYGFFLNPDGTVIFTPDAVGSDPNVSNPVNTIPGRQIMTADGVTYRFLRSHTPPDDRSGFPAPYEDEILVNKGYLNERLQAAVGLPNEWIIAPTQGTVVFPEHQRAYVDYEASIAVGIETMAIHTNPGANQGACGAFGFGAYANGLHAIAAGTQSVAGPATWDGSNWIRDPEETGLVFPAAFGNRAAAIADQTLALGHRTVAQHLRSVAIGAHAETTRPDAVSVGNATLERIIERVADATEEADAVNLRTLLAAASELMEATYNKELSRTLVLTETGGATWDDEITFSYTNDTLVPRIVRFEVDSSYIAHQNGAGRAWIGYNYTLDGNGQNRLYGEAHVQDPVTNFNTRGAASGVYIHYLEPGWSTTFSVRGAINVDTAFDAASTAQIRIIARMVSTAGRIVSA